MENQGTSAHHDRDSGPVWVLWHVAKCKLRIWNVNFTRGLVMRVDTNNKKKAFIRVAGRTQADTYCGRHLAAENRVTNRRRHTKGQISKPGRGPFGHIKRQTFSKAYNIYKTCLFRVDARLIICNSRVVSNLMLGVPRYTSLIQTQELNMHPVRGDKAS